MPQPQPGRQRCRVPKVHRGEVPTPNSRCFPAAAMSTHPSRACVRVRCFQNTRVHTTSVTLGQGHSALSNKLGLTLSLAWRLQDLKAHLRAGVTLDELWRVARGELRYADWLKQRGGLGGGSPGGSGAGGVGAAPAAPPAASVPQELVNVQAYLLWEKARASVAASFTAWLPLHAAAPACSYGSRRGLTVIVCQGRSQAIMIHLPDDMVECSSGAAHRPHEVIRRLWCDVRAAVRVCSLTGARMRQLAAVTAAAAQAGRPDGADFAGDARRMLAAQLAQGRSVADLEKALRSPKRQASASRAFSHHAYA